MKERKSQRLLPGLFPRILKEKLYIEISVKGAQRFTRDSSHPFPHLLFHTTYRHFPVPYCTHQIYQFVGESKNRGWRIYIREKNRDKKKGRKIENCRLKVGRSWELRESKMFPKNWERKKATTVKTYRLLHGWSTLNITELFYHWQKSII